VRLKTIISPAILYGCETCSLTLREELRLRVFMNRVLRRIFGPKRDEAIGERMKLHIVRKIGWGGCGVDPVGSG
jgi:hypothetical protein